MIRWTNGGRSKGLMAAVLFGTLLTLASAAEAQPSTCNNRTLSSSGSITPADTPATVQASWTASTGPYWTVTAAANASYTFTYCSNGGSYSNDPWLCLFNSSGALITQNDDSCGLGSQIVQQLTAGTYYIAAAGFSSSSGSGTLAYFAPGVIPNVNPDAPTGLIQAATSGGTAQGSGFVSDATAYFRATVTDSDAGDVIGVQVEILPASTPFGATITGQTATTAQANMVASGGVAEVLYVFDTTPYGSGDYHWRLRAVDDFGGTSAWVEFDNTSINMTVDLDPPTSTFPTYVPGEGSTVGVTPPGGDVGFSWGAASDVGPPGPISYRIEVSTSASFASTIHSEIANTNSHILSLAISPSPYYWHVSAIDQSGNQGPWSQPIAFFVEFDDGTNHGGGDCVQGARGSPGSAIGLLVAFLIAGAAFRKI